MKSYAWFTAWTILIHFLQFKLKAYILHDIIPYYHHSQKQSLLSQITDRSDKKHNTCIV
jgi:hypothetical protein